MTPLTGAAGVFDSAQALTTLLTSTQSAQLNFPVTGPIFVAVAWRITGTAVPTVTDSAGNTYVLQLSQNTGETTSNSAALFLCANPTQAFDGTTITVQVNMSIGVNNLFLCPFTLCIPATPLIIPGSLTGVAYPIGTQPHPSIAMNLPDIYDTVIAICYGNGTGQTVTPGWTVVQQSTSSGHAVFSIVPSTSGAFTAQPCSYNATAKPGNVMIVFAMAPTPNIGFSVDQNGKTLPGGLTPIRPFGDTVPPMQASPVWGYPFCSGLTIRMQWSDLSHQPPSGNNPDTDYNWNYIDQALAQAQATGKMIGIIFGSGAMAPDWVMNSGINTFDVDQGTGLVPAPWDLDYQLILQAFIKAFAHRYDNHPCLTYIVISGFGWQTGMAFCRSDADNAELYATTYNGRTGLDLLYNAFQQITQMWMLAFKKTRLLVDFYSPIFPNNLANDTQIGVPWMNWLLSIAPVGQIGTKYNNWNISLGPAGQDITPAKIAHAITLTNPAGGQPQHAGVDQWPAVLQNGISWGLQFIEAYLGQAQGDVTAAPGGVNWQYQCMLLLAAARTTRNFSPFNPPIPYVPVPIPDNPFAPYAGQDQQTLINVQGPPPPWEDGPRVMPPLPSNQVPCEVWLPPPVKQTDIFTAQQTWPL